MNKAAKSAGKVDFLAVRWYDDEYRTALFYRRKGERMKSSITVICGHYGCGKTNLVLNLAAEAAQRGRRSVVVDMDVVNPYFRSSDYSALLKKLGVELIAPVFANTTLDTPVLPPEIFSIFNMENADIFIDAGGFFAQGIGTSMLQVPNIIKNPRIWLAPTLASAVTGPIATCVFGMQMNGAPISSGMGTCGLVGQIGVYTGWLNDITAGAKTTVTAMDWLGLVLICFVLPAVLSFVFDLIFRKIGWVKDGDMKIDA